MINGLFGMAFHSANAQMVSSNYSAKYVQHARNEGAFSVTFEQYFVVVSNPLEFEFLLSQHTKLASVDVGEL